MESLLFFEDPPPEMCAKYREEAEKFAKSLDFSEAMIRYHVDLLSLAKRHNGSLTAAYVYVDLLQYIPSYRPTAITADIIRIWNSIDRQVSLYKQLYRELRAAGGFSSDEPIFTENYHAEELQAMMRLITPTAEHAVNTQKLWLPSFMPTKIIQDVHEMRISAPISELAVNIQAEIVSFWDMLSDHTCDEHPNGNHITEPDMPIAVPPASEDSINREHIKAANPRKIAKQEIVTLSKYGCHDNLHTILPIVSNPINSAVHCKSKHSKHEIPSNNEHTVICEKKNVTPFIEGFTSTSALATKIKTMQSETQAERDAIINGQTRTTYSENIIDTLSFSMAHPILNTTDSPNVVAAASGKTRESIMANTPKTLANSIHSNPPTYGQQKLDITTPACLHLINIVLYVYMLYPAMPASHRPERKPIISQLN